MRSTGQLLVIVALVAAVLAIGAYESMRPVQDPQIVRWARQEATKKPLDGARPQSESGDSSGVSVIEAVQELSKGYKMLQSLYGKGGTLSNPGLGDLKQWPGIQDPSSGE